MDLAVKLTAPNGVNYTQPLGLFINNEFVASSEHAKIRSIDPSHVLCVYSSSSSG